MSEVIGSVQVVVRPDTTGFAKKARKDIEKQFARKNALELDFEVDPDQIRRDIEDSHDVAQKWLDLKKNALKVTATLSWNKRDLLSQLRDFKADVEALEKLQRPTIYANFEVDRKGLDAIREDIKLNVELDPKTLQRSIKKATEDITIFGDSKELKEKTESAAKRSSQIFRDIFTRRRLRLEIDTDTEEIEKAQKAMEDALGRYSRSKGHLEGLEDSLAGVTKEMNRQANLVKRLTLEWKELEESGDLNARQLSSYANSLREAEDALADMVRHEKRIRNERDRYSNNIFSPSLDGAKRLQREFEALERKLDDKKVEISAVAERSSFLAVAAELALLARDRMVLFWARVQKLGMGQVSRQFQMISKASGDAANNVGKWLGQLMGVRVLWRTFRDMVDWLPRLDMMVPQLAQSLALITSATAGAVGGVGILFTLLSDIGEVGKLIIGLPAALVGLVGSALIVGRAIADFKEVFPEIISYYEELGELVSDKVWERAAGGVRKLHAATKPLLDAYVPDWATAWGDSMASLAKGLSSDSALGNLETFLKNSILGTKNATKGWESLGNAIMSMVGGGSSVFPELGTWFSDTMADFESWAQANQSNMGRWLREGATALGELGSIGVSTVKIIAGIADAFESAGWPGLTEAAGAMRSLGEGALQLKNSDSFMQTLEQIRGFFEEMEWLGPRAGIAIKNAWGMIGSAAEILARPISLAIGGILDGFNSAKFQDGFGTFLTGLGSFIEDVTPGLEAMTAEIGSLLGVVGTAGKSWGPAFNDMLLLFSDAGDKLHPGLIDFVENTGPDLQRLVRDLRPHIEDFAEALSDLLGNENFQEFATDMVETFGTIVGGIIDLGGWIVDLVGKFSDWYGGLGDTGQAVVRWGIIIGGALGGAALAIAGFALKLAGPIAQISGFFKWFSNTKLGTALGKGLSKMFAPLRGLGSAIGRVLAPIGRVLGGLGSRLLGLFPKGGLLKIIRPIFARFLGFLAGPAGWALLIASITRPIDFANMADWIVDALGFEDTWLGRLTESIKTDIEKMFGNKSLLDIIIDNFKNAFSKFADGDIVGGLIEVVKGLIPTFNFIQVFGDAILNALGFSDGQIADAHGTIARVWEEGGIGGIAEMLWTGFTNSFEMAWDQLMSYFTDYEIPSPLDFFGWLWDKLTGWLSLDGGEGTSVKQDALMADIDYSENTWADIKGKLQEAWDKLVGFFMKWSPAGIAFRFGSWLGGKIKGWLGIEGGINLPSIGELAAWGTDFWNNKVLPKLQSGWDGLIGFFMKWSPIGLGFRIASWLGEKIKGWLGIEGGINLPSIGELAAWGTNFWNDKVKPKLQGGWDALLGFIKDWSPIGMAFRLGTWVGGKIKEWLGIKGDGGLDLSGFSISFDFSSLWENKIKPALKTGLIVLGGLIAAPGLILIAPLALPGLIIGWLLGRDGEGKWSFQELTDKIKGAWDKIKGALTSGVEAIGGFIGGLVMSPVILGKTVAGWLMGDNWVADTVTTLGGAFAGAGPALGGAIAAGVESIRGAAETAGTGKTGPGWMQRLLGVDRPQQGQIKVDFDTVRSFASNFTGNVSDDYGGMSVRSRDHLDHMDKETKSKFGSMKSNASSDASSMQTKVVSEASKMQQLAGAKAAVMAKEIAQHTSHANTQAVTHAATMQAQYVKQVTSMQTLAAAKAAVMSKEIAQHTSRANSQAVAHATAMQTQYVKQVVHMQGAVLTQMTLMSTRGAAQMSAMQTMVVARAVGMQAAVLAQMTLMSARSGAQMVQMQAAMLRAMTALQSGAVSSAHKMSSAYVAQMSNMMTRSITAGTHLRNALVRVLTINATGPGSSTGHSYASGLSAGLSRAASAAHAIRSRVLSALTFSAYSSGASVGSTFAAGLRDRAGAVARAANQLAAAARRSLPRSPAKQGPFSGSGWGGWGESIADELARGMRKGAPAVAVEASRMMASAAAELDNTARIDVAPDMRTVRTALADRAAAGALAPAASEGQLTAGDIENGVANGLARLIEPAGDRDIVALVRRANRNGAR